MSKLQNNFTTIEQSQRLLELGVPADSSDCVYYGKGLSPSTLLGYNGNQFLYSEIKESEDYIPCWSVGRLIEIYHICVGPGCSFTFHVCFPNLMSEIMYKLAEAKSNGWLKLEKLEE